MSGQAQLLELRGKVTSEIAKKNDVVHNMLRLGKCFPYRIRSLAMSSGYLLVIVSVNNSVYFNVKIREQVTAVLKILKGTKTVCPCP